MWVATKWDFFVEGGGHVWATLRLRLRLGIVLGWVCSNLNVLGACLIHIS